MLPSRRIISFILTLSLLSLVTGFIFGDRLGLLIGFAFAILMSSFSFVFGDRSLQVKFKTRKLVGQDPWRLIPIVESLSNKIQLDAAPEVHIVDSATPFVIFQDRLWKQPWIGVSETAIKICTEQELEALIAEALCQLKTSQGFFIQVLSLTSNSIGGFLGFLDHLLERTLPLKARRGFFFLAASPLLHLLTRLFRHRLFFQSDAWAAALVEDPKSLARALWKIESYCQAKPLELPPVASHFFVCSPDPGRGHWRLQPTLQRRIKRLTGTYPI